MAGTAFLLVALAALIIFTIFAYSSNFQYQRAVPEFCGDIFGYTNMTRAIVGGQFFGEHTPRPYLEELLKAIRAKGIAFAEYYEAVTPYAYHLDDLSGRIINQYPPGTGFLLTLLPLQYRLYFFPPLVILLFISVTAGVIVLTEKKLPWTTINTLLFAAFWIVILPRPLFNLYDVNSISPTYGILVAAGICLVQRSRWAFFLLGLATLFRVSSIIFTLPFFLAYYFLTRRETWDGLKFDKELLLDFGKKAAGSAGIFFLGGYALYLLYVWKLTGNPFHPTYPFYDRAFSDLNDILFNLRYFSLVSPYFLFDLFSVILVGLVSIRREWRWLLFAIALVLYNYLFFILHRVFVDNYVYASAFINLGIALAHIFKRVQELPGKRRFLVNCASSALLLLCALFTLARLHIPEDSPAALYEKYHNNYAPVFAGYDVVWGHLRGGTIEYLLDVPTLNYNDASKAARDEILLWMYNHGYRQAIWLNDIIPELAESLPRDLNQLHLPYQLRKVDDGYFGLILEINPGGKQGEYR